MKSYFFGSILAIALGLALSTAADAKPAGKGKPTATAPSEPPFKYDFNALPKIAISPPGIYACWQDDKYPTDRHDYYPANACYDRYHEIEIKLKARRAELEQNPEERGCLGKDWWTCVAMISLSNQVTTGSGGGISGIDLIDPKREVDLNGKVLPRYVSLNVWPAMNLSLPEQTRTPIAFELALDDDGHVKQISVRLSHYPSAARSVEDWEYTGTYEAMVGIFGPDCVGDRMEFYKFYQKSLENMKYHGSTSFDGFSNSGSSITSICSTDLKILAGGGTYISSGSAYIDQFLVGNLK